MDRKTFIQVALGATGFIAGANSCTTKKLIAGEVVGASAAFGHILRDQQFGAPAETVQKQVVIVGGGISGLAAARHLQQRGINDFLLLDLEKNVGGNAASGVNKISSFPWGAHYIPTPNNNLQEYLDFLGDCNVITGTAPDGLPIYNDYYLCFDPQERLYINGMWQDGLVPHFGLPPEDLQQVEKFLHLMDDFRQLKGADGKDAFATPIDESSKDAALVRLDTITMNQWMNEQGFNSSYLHWYANYCTRDDFGTSIAEASAWIAIHYFAARKGRGSNCGHSDVITWPEGNGFLVKHLEKNISAQIKTQCLTVRIEDKNGFVAVDYFDAASKTLKRIEAKQCITAVPQFIAGRLLNDAKRLQKVHEHLDYTPWIVANMRVAALEERSGAPLSWDNVIYGSESLGYVEATHELLQQKIAEKNLTYYLPLTGSDAPAQRKTAQSRSHAEWVELVINDLQKVHPNIREALRELNIMIWGHAMAKPKPGLIHGATRRELSASINNCIHFAHTDLAGASIFEEAFYQGLKAAKKVITNIT